MDWVYPYIYKHVYRVSHDSYVYMDDSIWNILIYYNMDYTQYIYIYNIMDYNMDDFIMNRYRLVGINRY